MDQLTQVADDIGLLTGLSDDHKHIVETVLATLNRYGAEVQVKVQPRRSREPFIHERRLEVACEDGQSFTVLFDMGLDFIEFTGTQYRISKPTYLVICRNL